MVITDPLAYFKLKARVMELGLMQTQLQTQLAALEQQKQALLAEHGVKAVAIRFDDATYAIDELDAAGQVIAPTPDEPPPPDAPDPERN
jgi:hypothetical protein